MGKVREEKMERRTKEFVDKAERIGVLGSPSSTANLTIDILGTAVKKRLVGSLSIFDYVQEGLDHYALGQIVEIEMRNPWTQDPTMKGIIRHRGRVDPITERQDIHTASMTVSSVFSDTGSKLEQSILGTVPPTGTSIKLLNDEIMTSLLSDYQEQLFYLGNAYGTSIPLPMWFKHFGVGEQGAGEAYHFGIFGKTGSGKSVLAKMILCGYSKHEEMSIFILDPQGEFSRDFQSSTNLRDVIKTDLGKTVEVYTLHNLVLTGWSLFKKLLMNSGFLGSLGIVHENNQERAANQIERILLDSYEGGRKNPNKVLGDAHQRFLFDVLWSRLQDDQILINIYSSEDLRERVRSNLEAANKEDRYQFWKRIANLFTFEGKEKATWIKRLVNKIHEKNSVTIIDLSEINVPREIFWNDAVKFIVLGKFIEGIKLEAETKYKENQTLNSLVIIDEAHRLAPRQRSENEDIERVKEHLIDAVRTTRKYGLGWMFISQTLSSLHRDIINQVRIYIFGFGLGWGIERDALREIIGGQREAMTLYQRFNDPQSSLGEKQYSFMSYGPISPLSFSGAPLFFNAYKFPDEFMTSNFD